MKNRILKPVLCERTARLWQNERGFVAWHGELKSRHAAQELGEAIITGEFLLLEGDLFGDSLKASCNPPKASGFIVEKLAAKRWQVVAFAADRGITI